MKEECRFDEKSNLVYYHGTMKGLLEAIKKALQAQGKQIYKSKQNIAKQQVDVNISKGV
jgi:hypothetical protein